MTDSNGSVQNKVHLMTQLTAATYQAVNAVAELQRAEDHWGDLVEKCHQAGMTPIEVSTIMEGTCEGDDDKLAALHCLLKFKAQEAREREQTERAMEFLQKLFGDDVTVIPL